MSSASRSSIRRLVLTGIVAVLAVAIGAARTRRATDQTHWDPEVTPFAADWPHGFIDIFAHLKK